MKVVDKRDNCRFESLSDGDVFKFDGKYYMKMVAEGSTHNAVCLEYGHADYFMRSTMVEKVDCELVIK